MTSELPANEVVARIKRIARAEPECLGLRDADREIEVELIGRGESFVAWLLKVDGSEPVVVRIAHRPMADLPRPMAEEFTALGVIPAGMGPAPVLLEETHDNPLGFPYMVTGYVPGQIREFNEWNNELLAAHARQTARLHEQSFTRCGAISLPAEARSPKLSLTGLFASSLDWWQASHPGVVGDPAVSRLLPRIEAFIAAAAPAFDRLDRFSIIHGDLVVPNILIDEAGTPRYIDWEWAEIGDPAQDLAYIGGHLSAPPWYLPLERRQIRGLLEHYLHHADNVTGETVDTLETRRDAWEVYERFFSSLHFRTQRGTPADVTSGRYTNAVEQLTAGLDSRLP